MTVEAESTVLQPGNLCVPLAKYRPRLGGVFGPLSCADDRAVWSALSEVDVELQRLGGLFKRAGASLLELTFLRSGQLGISGYVSTADGTPHVADFGVALRPSWYFGEGNEEPEWEVVAEIEVDCQHQRDHRSMHAVWHREVRRATPSAAASALVDAARELYRLGSENPLEYWLAKAKDD